MYFTKNDYDMLTPPNSSSSDMLINKMRKQTQEKLLEIHKIIKKEMNDKNLHEHWMEQHVTSLPYPMENINKNNVAWMGVRYGKPKEKIYLERSRDQGNPFEGFQKHACLQFALYGAEGELYYEQESFNISFFLAVPEGSADRDHWRANAKAITLLDEFASANKGSEYVWELYYPAQAERKIYDFKSASEKLSRFLKNNDFSGCFSSLRMLYKIDDPRIETMDKIINEIRYHFDKFLPLYKAMAWGS